MIRAERNTRARKEGNNNTRIEVGYEENKTQKEEKKEKNPGTMKREKNKQTNGKKIKRRKRWKNKM